MVNKGLKDYILERGLRPATVAQQMKASRQSLNNYGKIHTPTARTLSRIAKAMTELGAPTTVKDIISYFYNDEEEG